MCICLINVIIIARCYQYVCIQLLFMLQITVVSLMAASLGNLNCLACHLFGSVTVAVTRLAVSLVMI